MGRVWRRKGDLQARARISRARSRAVPRHRRTPAASRARSTTSARRCRCSVATTKRSRRSPRALAASRQARRSSARSRRRLSRLGDVPGRSRASTKSAYNCHQGSARAPHADRRPLGSPIGLAKQPRRARVRARRCRQGARGLARRRCPEAESIGALPLAALAPHQPRRGRAPRRTSSKKRKQPARQRARDHRRHRRSRARERSLPTHGDAREALTVTPKSAAQTHAERALEPSRSKAGLREKEAQAYLTLGDVLSTSLYDAGEDQVSRSRPRRSRIASAIERAARDRQRSRALGKAFVRLRSLQGRRVGASWPMARTCCAMRSRVLCQARAEPGRPATSRSCSPRSH